MARGPGRSHSRLASFEAIVVLCVGGLGVTRSVQDEAFRDRILAACRDFAKAGLVPDMPTSVKPPRKRKGK